MSKKSVISITNLLSSFHFAITLCLKISASIHPHVFLTSLWFIFQYFDPFGMQDFLTIIPSYFLKFSYFHNFNYFLVFNYFLIFNYFLDFNYFHFIFAADGQVGPRQEELIIWSLSFLFGFYFYLYQLFFISIFYHLLLLFFIYLLPDGQVGPRQEELIQRVNYGRDSANSVNSLSSSASSNRLTIITNIKRSLQCKIVNNSEEFLDFWDQHRWWQWPSQGNVVFLFNQHFT